MPAEQTHHDRHTDADATQGGAMVPFWRLDASLGERLLIEDEEGGILAEVDSRGFDEHEDALVAARQITALPSLLAALSGMVALWDGVDDADLMPDVVSALKAARAALALATRREPNDAGR